MANMMCWAVLKQFQTQRNFLYYRLMANHVYFKDYLPFSGNQYAVVAQQASHQATVRTYRLGRRQRQNPTVDNLLTIHRQRRVNDLDWPVDARGVQSRIPDYESGILVTGMLHSTSAQSEPRVSDSSKY